MSDIRHLGPATPPRPEFYQPYTQRSFPFMAFVVRTHGHADGAGAVDPCRRHRAWIAAQPISGVSTMEQHIATALSRPRFMSTLDRVLRLPGARAQHGRRVRRHGLFGRAAHARDRHPHGARGHGPRRADAGGRQGDVARGCRRRCVALPRRSHCRACCRDCSSASRLRIPAPTPPSWACSRPLPYWPPRYRPGVPCEFQGRPS